MLLEERTCVGCGNQFMVMNVSGANSYYCTSDCKESHSLFKTQNLNQDKVRK